MLSPVPYTFEVSFSKLLKLQPRVLYINVKVHKFNVNCKIEVGSAFERSKSQLAGAPPDVFLIFKNRSKTDINCVTLRPKATKWNTCREANENKHFCLRFGKHADTSSLRLHYHLSWVNVHPFHTSIISIASTCLTLSVLSSFFSLTNAVASKTFCLLV